MDPNILIFGIVATIVLIIITIVYLLIYSGFFHRVIVGAGKPPVQDLYVAYKFRKGPYKNAGEMFTEIVSLAPNQRSIGVYYDDPEQVEEHKLRFLVGCVMAEGSQRPDKALAEQLQKRKYKFTYFPAATNVVKTTFPCTTTLSIYIAISRVYPLLGSYIREHKLCAHPIMEVYDGGVIHFLAPLARQDEFYVPETEDGYVDEDEARLDFHPIPPDYSTSGKSQTDISDLDIRGPQEKGQGDALKKSDLDGGHIPAPVTSTNSTAVSTDTAGIAKNTNTTSQIAACSVSNDQQGAITNPDSAAVTAGNSNDHFDDKSSSSSFEEVPMDMEELK